MFALAIRKFQSSTFALMLRIALMLGVAAVVTQVAAAFGPMVQLFAMVAVLFAAAAFAGAMARAPPIVGSQAGLSTNSFIGIFFAVLILVIGIALGGTVMTESANILGHASIASFPLVETVIEFLPVIYVAGLFGLAGSVAFFSIRR